MVSRSFPYKNVLQYNIYDKHIFRQFNMEMFAVIEMKFEKFLHTSKSAKALITGNMQYIIKLTYI
jgi:hypothetical protein